MIRINLLKSQPNKRSSAHLPIGRIVLVAAIAVILVAGVGAAWKFRTMFTSAEKVQPQEKTTYTVNPEAAPSTFSKQNIVEETVREVSDEHQQLSSSGMLSLPYAELSFAEKMNYEILFAKNVVEVLARAVPPGVGLRSLDLDNFQTVYAVGLAPSREVVQTMLSTLKVAHMEVLPPPYSFVKQNDAQSCKFAMSCKPEFGLNLADPIIDAPYASNLSVDSLLAAFGTIAKECNIIISKAPAQVSSEKTGGFYRMQYQWSGSGSYKNVVKFLTFLYQANARCAFRHISLNAVSGSNLKIESRFIVTTKD